MPNWNTKTRGQNRDTEDSYFDNSDYDGKSCSDHHQLPGRGVRDVEDLTMLSGLQDYPVEDE